ncbi:MFS multidrug transporter-like protein [Apiospora hydei]|uniref:MFS multidrug transporter-like protein n=1 Tax=Apiospora hydei TaxID=1337664 RepID=A0ABR1V2A5_9PEZI
MAVDDNLPEKRAKDAGSISSSPSRGSSDDMGSTAAAAAAEAAGVERDIEEKSIGVAPELPPPTGNVGGALGQDGGKTGAPASQTRSSGGSSTRCATRHNQRFWSVFDYSQLISGLLHVEHVDLPLWWSSFSETLGRRTIYLVSFALNVVFCLVGGFSVNIAMLIVFRILAGGASASVQAVGAGTIADIWEPRERGRAMGMFYLGPLMGPLLAPIIGGVLAEAFGWRSTLWFLTAFGAVVFLLILFALPETLAMKKPAVAAAAAAVDSDTRAAAADGAELSRVSTTRSIQVRTKHMAKSLKRFFIDPLQVVTYLRFPAVAITVYYASITFGSLYVLNVSIQSAFSAPPYGFSSIVVGLLYLPGSLGYFVASLLGGRWIDRIMHRAAERAGRYDAGGRLVYLPEDRMRENAWISATLFPGALVWYGWSVQHGVHWIVPGLANFFFGVGSMLVFSAATTMLTEFMPRRSSSGVALNNFVRNLFSCTGGVVGQPSSTSWATAGL